MHDVLSFVHTQRDRLRCHLDIRRRPAIRRHPLATHRDPINTAHVAIARFVNTASIPLPASREVYPLAYV